MPLIPVQILSKRDCCLCDQAKIIIERVAKDYSIELIVVDIEQDRELYEKYSELIPVVFVAGKKLFIYKVDEKILRDRLTRLTTV